MFNTLITNTQVIEPADVIDFFIAKYREEAVIQDLTENYEVPR